MKNFHSEDSPQRDRCQVSFANRNSQILTNVMSLLKGFLSSKETVLLTQSNRALLKSKDTKLDLFDIKLSMDQVNNFFSFPKKVKISSLSIIMKNLNLELPPLLLPQLTKLQLQQIEGDLELGDIFSFPFADDIGSGGEGYLFTNLSQLAKCVNLTYLDLDVFYLREFDFLINMSKLQFLSVTNTYAGFNYNLISNCLNLKTLKINGCKVLETLSMFEEISQLEILELRDCDNLDDIDALPQFAHLNKLLLGDLSSLESLEILAQCPNLTSLTLIQPRVSLWTLEPCLKLTMVRLYHYEGKYLSFLENCPNLLTLILDDCRELRDLKGIESCPNLTTVTITYCRWLKSINELNKCSLLENITLKQVDGLKNLIDIKALSSLQKLDITGQFKCSDTFLYQCPNLISMRLISVENEGEFHLPSLPKLQLLDLTRARITSLIGEGSYPELKKIILDRHIKLKNISLSKEQRSSIIENLPIKKKSKSSITKKNVDNPLLIEELSFSKEKISQPLDLKGYYNLKRLRVDSDSINNLDFVIYCPLLRLIDVSGCNNLRDISAIRYCTKLEGLSLERTNVTNLNALKTCPRLKLVNLGDTKLSKEKSEEQYPNIIFMKDNESEED